MTTCKRPHYQGTDPVTPEPGSRGWIRIINRGCGGHRYWTEYGHEFDCTHGYGWACDECPIGIEANERRQVEWEIEHQGPPMPAHLRPAGMFIFGPTVAGDLTTEDEL